MFKERLKPYLLYLNKLQKIQHLDIYIVGGFLRDLYINGTYSCDIDLIVSNNAKEIASLFLKKFKGVFVVLDEDEEIYRIVVKIGKENVFFDFSTIRGNLENDLKQRDFTINSLAWKINTKLDFKNVIDLCDGISDIKNKIIKCIDKNNFKDDPLRLLRTFRFKATLDFEIENNTRLEIKKRAKLLKIPSKERIAYEIKKIFGVHNCFKHVLSMFEQGVLKEVFNEIKILEHDKKVYYHEDGLIGHSLETLFCLEYIVENLKVIFDDKEANLIEDYLKEKNKISNLKIATLFHDLGKPETFDIIDGKIRFFGHERISARIVSSMLKRLKFSNNDRYFIKNIASFHMRIGNLVKSCDITDKAYYRYFKHTGDSGIAIILITLADCLASIRGGVSNKSYKQGINKQELKLKDFRNFKDISSKLISWKLGTLHLTKKKRILSGFDIMKKFNLPEGEIIGRILDIAQEEYILGNISTKKEAINLVRRWLEEHENNK